MDLMPGTGLEKTSFLPDPRSSAGRHRRLHGNAAGHWSLFSTRQGPQRLEKWPEAPADILLFSFFPSPVFCLLKIRH